MATLVANTSAKSTDNTNVTTTGIDTTGADLLVLVVVSLLSSDPTPTDSKSNSWSGLTLRSGGGSDYSVRLWYCQGGTVGASHTFTIASGSSYPSICAMAFSGSAATPLDQQNGATGDNVGTLATGSITPTQDNCIIVSGIAADFMASGSVSESMTITDKYDWNSGQAIGGAAAYKFQAGAAAINPTWTLGKIF